MSFFNPSFKYTVEDSSGKLVITVGSKIPTANRIMIMVYLVLIVAYSYYKSVSTPNIPSWTFYLILLCIAIGIGVALLISKGLGRPLTLIIDKSNKTLKDSFDGFKISLTDIADIKINETKNILGTRSVLKVYTTQGEKTLAFPFTSYSEAEKILNLIKSNL